MHNTAKKPNLLAGQTSPYLLQHAYNPVNWQPWGADALNQAKAENKPLLISIGYSACHWCHVMERESFENEEIAALMNSGFVCIKIDREEHPEVDNLYMESLQLMGIHGGWPLNIFALPDGKPFYGGTYFPPAKFMRLLHDLINAFANHLPELQESGNEFAEALNRRETDKYKLPSGPLQLNIARLPLLYQNLEKHFDTENGGMGTAPKFPMPSVYRLLLLLYASKINQGALTHTVTTLTNMAFGGIYDQIGGGFSRYSTDDKWFAPHFEKMAYDNGQLLSLYAEAALATHNPLFTEVLHQTADFVLRELTSPENGFYAALDADSEGVEGLFYTFSEAEMQQAIGPGYILAVEYYNALPEGNWEGRNILHRNGPDAAFARLHGLSEPELTDRVAVWKEKLFAFRAPRVRPGLDDKILTGWNALLMKGLADAFRATGNAAYLQAAEANADFLAANLLQNGLLFRTYKNGQARLPANLDDYALLIEALISLYQAGFRQERLYWAQSLCEMALQLFFDESENLFRFAAPDAEGELIALKKEIFDNVIPCGNSVMAHNLFLLSVALNKPEWDEVARRMLAKVQPLVEKEVRYMNNWARLYVLLTIPFIEIAVSGPQAKQVAYQLGQGFYYPGIFTVASETASELPLLEFREPEENGQTLIYICCNQTCLKPAESVEEALQQIADLRPQGHYHKPL